MDGGAIDGATETPIIRGQFDSDEASDAAKQVYASMTPLGRIGQPEELAAAVIRRRPWRAVPRLSRRSRLIRQELPTCPCRPASAAPRSLAVFRFKRRLNSS